MLVAGLCVPVVRRLALRAGLVDDPTAAAYKTHERVVPYGGGIAIYLGCLLPAMAGLGLLAADSFDVLYDETGWVSPWAPYWLLPFTDFATTVLQVSQVIGLFAAASLAWFLGMIDDRRGLSPLLRFVAQLTLAAALVAWVPGFRVLFFGADPAVSVAIGAVWITAIANAFNMLDNMDGLAGGVAAISMAGLVGIALASGHAPAAMLGLLVVGAACAFLMFNFPPASIFMGDSGGLFLGFSAGGLSLLLSAGASGPRWQGDIAPLAPLFVLAVPVYDLASVVAIRLVRGVPPWLGDRNHTSHRLVRLGLSRRDSVLVLYAASLTMVAVALCATHFGAAAGPAVRALALGALAVTGLDVWLFARRRGGGEQ